MNKLFTTVLFTLLCAFGFAQAPRLINYQGIARDALGAPITETVISLKFEILQGSTVVFSEEHPQINTNKLGLFSTQIGSRPGSTLNIDWENGNYKLQVYMDMYAGSNFLPVGIPQDLASVPYALHAASVPAAYENNILTIGNHSISLPTPTLNGGGLVSVSTDTSTGANYTITVPEPTLNINGTSISISNGNTVTVPETSVTANAAGIASVNAIGTNSFEIFVPAPQLSISGSSLISISNGNSIVLPVGLPEATVTANAAGIASVVSVGTNSFDIYVPNPQLALVGSTLSIVGSNSVNIANVVPTTSVTASGLGSASSTLSPGLNVFNVNVPLPTYNGAALSFGGTNTVNIAPTLSLSGTILSAGLPSNSVSLVSSSPWKIGSTAPISILQTTAGLPVGIGGAGMTSASALLDVQGTNTLSGSIIKAINANSSNTFAVLDIQTNGSNGLGMNINNTAATGDGAHFQTLDGYALHTQNNSASTPAFYAKNNGGGSAGYFIGGFTAQGSTSNNSAFAIQAQNSSATPLFAVRNDGAVSVGAFSVTAGTKLDVNGVMRLNDGTQGSGKILTSDANGVASWKSLPPAISFGGLNQSDIIANTTPAPLSTSSMVFIKQYANTEVDVALYSALTVGTFASGASAVSFEIYVDGSPSSAAGSVFVIKTPNTETYANIRSVFSGLAAGSHTITIVAYTNAGTCANVLADPGGWNGKVIVKETF